MSDWKKYSAFEWVMIDVASRYGLDKKDYPTRILWCVNTVLPIVKLANGNFNDYKILVRSLIDKADEKPMFTGAVIALWDAAHGNPSTWQVGQDAASSGPQLLSVLLKDTMGMLNCGVMCTDVPDLYTKVTQTMNSLSGGNLNIERSIVKKGIVPHIYASEQEPKRVFEKAYPVFLKAYRATVRMAQEASDIMVAGWNSNATEHNWHMPDGARIRVPVLVKHQKTIPCGKHSFEYIYEAVGTKEAGTRGTKSLSANTTHSYDAYMLRELNRRANYDRAHIQRCLRLLMTRTKVQPKRDTDHLLFLEQLCYTFNQPSAVAFEFLDEANVHWISDGYANVLIGLAEYMLGYQPFQITNIHDEFKTLPKDVGTMKQIYNVLLMETYMSQWWMVTAKELTGKDYGMMVTNPDETLLQAILDSPYSIG